MLCFFLMLYFSVIWFQSILRKTSWTWPSKKITSRPWLFGDKQTSSIEVDEGPSELRLNCFLTPLSSISINLYYYVLYILALAAWSNKGHRILLHNTGPCHLCCHKTPSQGCHYPSHPAHIVTWPRRHRAPDNSQIIWWNQSGIAICISRGEASRKIHHKCINSSHVVNRYIRSILRYYYLLKWVKNHEVIGYCDDDDFVILRQISWQSEQWTWHGGGRDIPWPGPEQDTVYSSIISRDDDLKFHPFQNHASAERFHSALFSSHNQARG